jgi:membrane protein
MQPAGIVQKGIQWFLDEIKYLLKVLISSLDRFYWDNGFSKAASLAYTTLLSLVPIMTLCFGFLGTFQSLQQYLPEVAEFVFKQFVPNASGVNEVLQKINEFNASIASLNVVVIPFLVITSILLINSIEYALNQVWQVYETRTIAHRIAIYCAIIVIAPILALSAFYTTKYRVEPLLRNVGDVEFFTTMYNFLLPFLIDYIAFASLYYLVPKAPVLFRSATFGAFIAATLFDMAKAGFAIYIRSFSSYTLIYGTLAAIPIFLFWLYLAWAIILLGAEISYQVQYLPRSGKLWKRTLLSIGDGSIVIALQALIIIARAFSEGKRLPNALEISEKLGCSSLVLKPTLDALKASNILAQGDSRDMPLALKRSPDKITVQDIKEAIYQSREAVFFSKEIRRAYERFEEERADSISLGEIIRN